MEWWKYLFASEKHDLSIDEQFWGKSSFHQNEVNILKRSQFLSKLKCTGKYSKHEQTYIDFIN
jgi:hypothetical protein